jgi:hypothetical protein
LLQAYERGGYPGAFRLVENGTVTHVVPRQAADATGVLRAWTPILDAQMSLPVVEESVLDRVRRLVAEVSQRTGWSIELGTVPINLLARTRADVTKATAPESARAALSRALASTGHSLSWRMYFAPGPAGRFFLNIHPVAGAARPVQRMPTKARG